MFWAWLGALLVGLSLGLLGSGGSILTVPVLVYLVDEPEKVAIAESLAIVGLISLAGAVPYAIRNRVHWKSVLYFGIPGMIGTYGGAFFAAFVSGTVQLVVFALVMLLAALLMYWNGIHERGDGKPGGYLRLRVVAEGLGVGVMTGFVGVGGGFLIVPALVIMEGLPISLAIGTSLVIISMKSFSGFYKYINLLPSFDLSVNWTLILIFSLIGIMGSFAGKKIGDCVSGKNLQKGFSVFLVAMACYILWMNA